MPTIYTEDKVAKDVAEHAIGEMGHRTGSAANSLGYEEHKRRRAVSAGGSASSGGSYEFLGFTQALLDAVPERLQWILGWLSAVAAIVVCFAADTYDANHFLALDAGLWDWLAIAFFAFVGFSVGFWSIPLLIGFLDLALKIVVIGGGLAAVVFLLLWLFDA